MLALPGRHLAHERHAPSKDLQQVAIERVDHGPHHGQWTRGGRPVLRAGLRHGQCDEGW
jgi:hypothetical protein